MAQTELKTGTGGGTQANTQSPQSAAQPTTGGAQASSVQPGTTNDLLNQQAAGNDGGVPLSNPPLTTVGLDATATTTVAQAAKPTPKHEFQPALIAFPVVLLLAAVLVAWFMKRSVNNTTY